LTPPSIAHTICASQTFGAEMQTKEDWFKTIRNRAMTGEDCEGLKRQLDSWLTDGATVSDLTDVLDGTPWRYIVAGSGSHVLIARIDDLMSAHRASFDALRAEVTALRVQDLLPTTHEEDLDQARTRMKVARRASAYGVGAVKLRRFLLPKEAALIDEQHDPDRLLESCGFEWNGGDIVMEIWSEEHAKTYARNMTELGARDLGQCLGGGIHE
jgi:hypothetical protein